ncbi:hypothetical protein Sj15T_18850 [Sphingobium sp. TA15]|uniref:LTD domain-containing protein n=2 Tax=Sphingomonadaceae TaxID=41297 RepID=D4Z4B7_SPHIU|nr:conserved hypothetical protein [Sphingobium indicum UT26S]BDD66864.1 hypothetical protein Sj15T_18850 [Sphingobium sp. TA15]
MACAAGLDFFAITEHNHPKGDGSGDRRDGILIATQPALYRTAPNSLVKMADAADQPGACVTLYGQEFSTISSGNHVNIFDIDQVIDVPNGRFDLLLEWLRLHPDAGGGGPLVQFNHPESGRRSLKDYGRDDFSGGEENWVQAMAPHVSLIEIMNAPALQDGQHQRTSIREGQYFRYLNLGFHLAPSVGQDNHYRNWGISTDARVAVIAADFSRRGIINALKARHAYATEDKNLRVLFRSGNALQGDIIDPPTLGAELPLTVEIVDDDEPDAIYRVDVFKDVAGGKPASAPVETFELVGNQAAPVPLEGIRLEALSEYVLLRITQLSDQDEEHAEDDRLWTAPIWFESSAFHHHMDQQPRLRIVRFVPDPQGDDFTREEITLANRGSAALNLSGWRVRDLAGNVWVLDGLLGIEPGEEKTMLRGGQPMSLNNGGDEIELVAPDGTVVQTIAYGQVAVDEEIRPDAID